MDLQRSTTLSHSLAPLLWIIVTLAASSRAAEFFLPASSSLEKPQTVSRSNSMTGQVVRLEEGDSIRIPFCLREETLIQIVGVLYSNDGPGETVAVVRADDSTDLGDFTSHNRSNWGELWNEFLLGPVLPQMLLLDPGQHTLQLKVLPPSDGIEVDAVHVWLGDERLSRALVDCSLVCTPELPDVPDIDDNGQVWQSASAQQRSYQSSCSEESNVKVPLFLGGISEYTVTATMPTYAESAANRQEANTEGCSFMSPLLFTFSLPDELLKSSSSGSPQYLFSEQGASLFAYGCPDSNQQTVRIEFQLQGRSSGSVDAEIGSDLSVQFKKSNADIEVKTTSLGRTGSMTTLHTRTVGSGTDNLVLQFPDFMWREDGPNVLLLQFTSSAPVEVTNITLQRRPMLGEKVQKVYDSASIVVEAMTVDFWWRRPEKMTLVNGNTGAKWSDVDFFRIALSVPGDGGFAQVFVMYQDGNVRLAPLPPVGVDRIPFGSYVIVGYSDPADLRPSAPVTSVTFYPETLTLNVQYKSGESAELELSSDRSRTQMTVKTIQTGNIRENWSRPFATLRSMYMEDGNSDCDSILVDGKSQRPIMDRWGTLQGKSFLFFRRCESQHLTLAPDIRIDVKSTSFVEENGSC